MTNYTIFIFILLAAAAYRSRRYFRLSRRRWYAYTGLGFCAMSFNLWAITRMDDIIASLPGTHSSDFFAMPWPWISALVVGITLFVISFLIRKDSRNAA
jgi:cytochrome bd-type quinol oxidase subunit 2